MTISTLRVEQTKLFSRKLYWIELAVLAALIVLVLGVVAAVLSSPRSAAMLSDGSAEDAAEMVRMKEAAFWPNGLKMAAQMTAGPGLGGLLMIVLAGAFVAQEYAWGTLAAAIAQGVPRPLALLAKIMQLLLAALLMCVVAVIAAGVTSAIITAVLSGPVLLRADDFVTALMIVGGSLLTLLPYIGLTVWLAVATRSTVAAIGIGIGWMLMEGPLSQLAMLLGGVWAQVVGYLPGALVSSLFDSGSPSGVDPLTAAIGLVLYGVLFSALAVWSFRRQDLTV